MAGADRKSRRATAVTAEAAANRNQRGGGHAQRNEIRPLLERVIARSIFVETSRRLAIRDPRFSMLTPGAALLNALANTGPDARDNAATILRTLNFPENEAIAAIEEAACQLGDYWLGDEQSFFEVSLSMARLQAAVVKAGHDAAEQHRVMPAPCALICTKPGEPHTFAGTLIDSILRANGWMSRFFVPDSLESLAETLADTTSDLVCLCLSGPGSGSTLDTVIDTWTRPDLHPRPFLAIGGVSAPTAGQWFPQDGRIHYGSDICSLMDVARSIVTTVQSEDRHEVSLAKSTTTRSNGEG